MSVHLCTGKEVGVGLDTCDDLTQDYTVREDISLKKKTHTYRCSNTKTFSCWFNCKVVKLCFCNIAKTSNHRFTKPLCDLPLKF